MTNVTFVRESGAIITNMESLVSPGFESNLVLAREHLFNKLEKIFDGKTIEAHVFGSIARGTTDAYSDIDIWFTLEQDFDTLEKVIENMKKVSNKKQKETLNVISGFAKKIFL